MGNKIENSSLSGQFGSDMIIDKIDLGTNFNGYPLENVSEEDMGKLYDTIMNNRAMRFRKNVDYQLVLAVVPVIKNKVDNLEVVGVRDNETNSN